MVKVVRSKIVNYLSVYGNCRGITEHAVRRRGVGRAYFAEEVWVIGKGLDWSRT